MRSKGLHNQGFARKHDLCDTLGIIRRQGFSEALALDLRLDARRDVPKKNDSGLCGLGQPPGTGQRKAEKE